MDQGIKEQLERLKEKAEYFLENNIKAFIKDKYDNYYFCDILIVGETHLYIQNFAGKRIGEAGRGESPAQGGQNRGGMGQPDQELRTASL